MKYMIVTWDKEKKSWIILHYSHSYDDARRWYDEYKLKYKEVQMMCDAWVLKDRAAFEEFSAFLKKFGKK